jgi:epsin
LTVLDYCLHTGSENVVIYFKDSLYIIQTLKEFQYIDEDDKDQGANVRQKAKDITNLLQDESRLREARKIRASMRDRMLNKGFEEESRDAPSSAPPCSQPEHNNIEDEYQRDLAAAIELSREEDQRKKAAEEVNARAVFGDK